MSAARAGLSVAPSPAARVSAIDWGRAEDSLDADGFALLPGLVAPEECRDLACSYDRDEAFRSRVVMARHGFGRGEYKYWAYPLPPLVARLRLALYPPLAVLANRWAERLGEAMRYPEAHPEFLARCRAAGQTKPTPLILKYGEGDYNCLHQDLYGEHVFPLQVAVLLSAPGEDFAGGEFVLVEARPRMQSRPAVVPLRQGDGVLFPVRYRPVRGARGYYRTAMRHGVSRLNSGGRYTLGIIFHNAQ
jgi:uncharacterized protein